MTNFSKLNLYELITDSVIIIIQLITKWDFTLSLKFFCWRQRRQTSPCHAWENKFTAFGSSTWTPRSITSTYFRPMKFAPTTSPTKCKSLKSRIRSLLLNQKYGSSRLWTNTKSRLKSAGQQPANAPKLRKYLGNGPQYTPKLWW